MLEDGATWFLIADGRRARVLIEPRRGAALESPRDLAMEIEADEIYQPQDRPPRGSAPVGRSRHAIDKASLHEQEERNFLRRVAERVGEAAKHHRFEHLVIAAPPRALGALRDLLPQDAQARIRAETPKDLLDEKEAKLRERLTDLLRH